MSTFEMSSSENKDISENSQGFKFSNLSWQSNMGNVNIRNVKFRGENNKQQKFEVQLSKFQGFKFEVKNINIRNSKCRWGDKVTCDISTFEIFQTSKMKRFAQTVNT